MARGARKEDGPCCLLRVVRLSFVGVSLSWDEDVRRLRPAAFILPLGLDRGVLKVSSTPHFGGYYLKHCLYRPNWECSHCRCRDPLRGTSLLDSKFVAKIKKETVRGNRQGRANLSGVRLLLTFRSCYFACPSSYSALGFGLFILLPPPLSSSRLVSSLRFLC